ncbi:MAG: DNA-binding IclR family transcriptional regulator [Paracoccaceae bacterium]|jgi:DNA-binding IclR family transcriptional regulator
MTDPKPAFGVPPVARAFHLLRYIGDGNACANPSRASKDTGINRTTLLRLLETLVQERMIEPNGDGGGYVLGTGLIHLAARALYSRDIVQIAQPELKELATTLGLSAHLGIIDGLDILYLLRETPNLHLVSNIRVGSRLPIHATTIGRIILAHLDGSARDQLLADSDLHAVTAKTATTRADLSAQLMRDRDLSVAWSVGNFEAGIGSAAVAVFDGAGKAVAAINVTGPEVEFTEIGGRRDDIHTALTRAAERVSQQLGYFPAAGTSEYKARTQP